MSPSTYRRACRRGKTHTGGFACYYHSVGRHKVQPKRPTQPGVDCERSTEGGDLDAHAKRPTVSLTAGQQREVACSRQGSSNSASMVWPCNCPGGNRFQCIVWLAWCAVMLAYTHLVYPRASCQNSATGAPRTGFGRHFVLSTFVRIRRSFRCCVHLQAHIQGGIAC